MNTTTEPHAKDWLLKRVSSNFVITETFERDTESLWIKKQVAGKLFRFRLIFERYQGYGDTYIFLWGI